MPAGQILLNDLLWILISIIVSSLLHSLVHVDSVHHLLQPPIISQLLVVSNEASVELEGHFLLMGEVQLQMVPLVLGVRLGPLLRAPQVVIDRQLTPGKIYCIGAIEHFDLPCLLVVKIECRWLRWLLCAIQVVVVRIVLLREDLESLGWYSAGKSLLLYGGVVEVRRLMLHLAVFHEVILQILLFRRDGEALGRVPNLASSLVGLGS